MKLLREIEIRYTTTGIDKAQAQADGFARSQGQVAKTTDTVTASEERSERRRRSMTDVLARYQQQTEMVNRLQAQAAAANDAVAASYDRIAQAEAAAERSTAQAAQASTQAMQASTKAVNDNESAITGLAKASIDLAVEHPKRTAAAVAASALALSSLAGAASTSLGKASDAMRGYAERTKEAQGGVSSLAATAADGLGLAATVAETASKGFGSFAAKFAPGAAGATALTAALGRLAPLLGPIGVALTVISLASSGLQRAYADLDKLVKLGERAERLDLGAPFVKSFEGVGKTIGLEVDQVAASLDRVSGSLREKFGQGNPLAKIFADLDAGGAGTAVLSDRIRLQAEVAQTTGQRFQVALAAMRELEASGKRLALLDLADKVLGPDFAERLRTGQITVAKLTEQLDDARGKELLRPEDVARALAVQRAIEQTKREIADAWESTIDFSAAAVKVKEAWLGVLDVTKRVLVSVNDSMAKTGLDRLKAQVAQMENVAIPDAVSKGQADRVAYLTDLVANWRAEIGRLSAASASAKPDLDVAPELRASSDAMQRVTEEAERAKTSIPGLDSALLNVAMAADNAAAKVGAAADAIRGIQNLNPDLSGILGYFDKVGQVQKALETAREKANVDFQKPGTALTGDEGAKAKAVAQAIDEQRRALVALEEQRNKPLKDIVTEGERTKLDDLGRSLAQVGDRTAAIRKELLETQRVAIAKLSDPAMKLAPDQVAAQAEAIRKQTESKIAQLDTAGKALETKARADAAQKAAKEAADANKADAYDNALQRTRDETEELEIQAGALTRVSEEAIRFAKSRELMRAARKAGRADDQGLSAEIDEVSAAYARQSVATDRAREAQARMRESTRALGDDFTRFFDDVLLGTGKLTDAFASMAKGLASSGLQAILTGQGSLAGPLGTANPNRGELGGILGGITPTAFRSLISDGVETGSAAGTETGLSFLTQGGQGLSGLMQGAAGGAMILGSYSVGQQSQSTGQAAIGGALSGAIGGAMLGAQLGAGPIGAVVGPSCGLGGMIGKPRKSGDTSKPNEGKPGNDRDQRPLAA